MHYFDFICAPKDITACLNFHRRTILLIGWINVNSPFAPIRASAHRSSIIVTNAGHDGKRSLGMKEIIIKARF